MNTKNIKEYAEKSYSDGLYCAESVVLSITKSHGIESDLLPKIASAFCSGMSRTCSTCGALTGAVLGISAVLGRSGPEESVNDVYDATSTLVDQFEKEFGSKNCHELLGCDLGTPEGQAHFKNNKLNNQCRRYTSRAAELAGNILSH